MARAETVRVKGLRELQRDLRKVEKGLRKEVDASLKLAAEPVVEQARANLARYAGAKLNTIKPRVNTGRVYVRQNARKVTGKRPDFGSLQMRVGLIPALQERQGEVIRIMEDQLDAFTTSHGLPMQGGI